MKLSKTYDSKAVETRWQKFWDKNRIYKFDAKSKKKVYSLDVPPPYASAGHLHIGHALHYTQFEIIARYRRMAGYNVHFAPCFDDNGLPTEKYVEEKFNISKTDTTKAEFRKLCLREARKVEEAYSDRFFRALGHSYDWSLLYTTIEPESQKVAQKSFIDLYKKGNVYRSEEPTLWCPNHQTALAQAEVEDLTRTTTLSYIDFDLENGKKINIATTRLEFLPACVGIFVHPDDKRYKGLVGKKAVVPLFNQKVPIMKDEKVDMEFGSGIVMICTFGDTTDIEWWKKHKLPLRICITKDAKLNNTAGKYEGMTLKEAANAMLRDLENEGRVTKKEKLTQTVGSCWRCNTPIEFMVTKQWFIKTLKYKKQLIQQGRKINWHPEFYRVRYEDWVKNLAWDWCISRQRFYGIPIPVWYCKKCGKVIIADEKQLPVDPEQKKPSKCSCGSSKFVPETDVFDTWMTSSMSPEIAVRWLEKPGDFKKMFPTSLRPQAQDIIRTWAFYTILKAYLHFNSIPWNDIALGTFVLDSKGRGMSKSKGNVVWADDMLKKYDVDTFRCWVGTASWGTDLSFQEKDLITGKKFLTKLWNACRFAEPNIKKCKPKKLETIDKWLLAKLNKVVEKTTKSFDEYKTGEAKRTVEHFFWHTLCDNYLEIVKDRLYNPKNKDAKMSAQYTLYHTLLSTLKLIAPIVPHITEELYQVLFKDIEKDKSIHISAWPKPDKIDKNAEKLGDIAVDIITALRKWKTSNNMALNKELKKVIIDSSLKNEIKKIEDVLKGTMKIDNIEFGSVKKADVTLDINKKKTRIKIERI